MPRSIAKELKVIKAVVWARTQAGLSQSQLSLRISRSRTLLQKIETGRPVRVTELTAIATATGVDPIELYRKTL
jgi:ribosome-binding protein aMBF1 (putative translation factor)